ASRASGGSAGARRPVPEGEKRRIRRKVVSQFAAEHGLPGEDVRVDLGLAEQLCRVANHCGQKAARAILSGLSGDSTWTIQEVLRLARLDPGQLRNEVARRTGRAPGNGARKRRA